MWHFCPFWMTKTIITSNCNYGVTFWKPEIARNWPSVEVDSNMRPIIIDALTPCLKTSECFRLPRVRFQGDHWFIAVVFCTCFGPILATFVNEANPIENNARKFATAAPYHLQCTRDVSNLVSTGIFVQTIVTQRLFFLLRHSLQL